MTAADVSPGAEWTAAACGGLLAGLLMLLQLDETSIVAIVTVTVGIALAWISWQDLKTFTIADGAIASVAALALAARWSASSESASSTALVLAFDAGLPAGVLFLFREIHYRRRGFDGLGFGDVKLAAAGGLLVGAAAFSWALFAAGLLALAYVGVSRLLSGVFLRRVAFGAALAPALWAVWVAQQTPLLLSLAPR